MDLIEKYISKGFSFFPLRKKSKKPLFDWAVYQTRRPTQEEVSDWRSKGLLNQVAIVCGAVSGIIVLDVDDPPTFEAWIKEHNYSMPPTPMVRTSGDKYHAYFKHPGGKIKNSVKKIPGADIKADGGYVVAPPSIHPNGAAYEWNEFCGLTETDFADPLPWIQDFCEREVTAQVTLAGEDLLPPEEDWVTEAWKGVPTTKRNDTAAKLAGFYLGRGDPEPRVLETLRGWNLKNPEPLPDKEIQATVASIGRKEARNRIRTDTVAGKAGPATDLPWEEQRQAALQGLGERLGLPISDIRVTKSDESVFEFFLGEADSVVITAAQLCEQRLFKSRFLSAALLVPKKIKEPKEGGAWDEVVRQMVRLAILQDVGQESTALGELREFLNAYVESYYGLCYYSPSQSIPPHVAFFIIQRKGDQPKLYSRVSELFTEARMLGYKTLKKLTILLPSLGHEPEKFKWHRQNVRAWCMNLDGMSQEIKEMVFRKAMEGREKEDALQDKR